MYTDQDNTRQDTAMLIEHCLSLPLAFAIWQEQGDSVLISSKLQGLLKVPSLLISSLEFVKNISNIFGHFLYEAVEKVSVVPFSNRKYSTNIRTKYNKAYNVSLRYNIRDRIYIFTAIDVDNTLNSNHIIEEYSNLKEKYALLNEMLDNIPIFVWYENKNSKLLYCNKEYANTQNTTIRDVINNNKHLLDARALPNQVDSTQQFNTDMSINNENKKMSVTRFVSTINNNYIIGVAKEYIDAKAMDEKTEQLRRCITQITDNVQDGLALFDVDNKLLFYNDTVLRLFNIIASDIDNKTFTEIVDVIISKEIFANSSKDYRNSLLENIQNIANDVIVKTIQLTNGKTIRVTVNVSDIKTMLFILTDITTNLAREREIRSVRTIYQTILNNIGDGTIIFGTDNRIKFINTVMYDVLKSSNNNIANFTRKNNYIRDCFNNIEFETEEVKTKFISELLNSAEQRVPHSEIVSFSEKTLECSYLPLPDGLNLLKFRDVSYFKSMEMDLKAASEKVAQITNLKSALITTIADEYVVPLSTITSLAEILDNKYFGELTEKQEKYCKSIIKTAGYLKDISEAITDIALIKTDQMNFAFTEVDINEFIQIIVDEISKNTSKLISFSPIHPSLIVYLDVDAIKKALYHIILKALYMINDDGAISIFVRTNSTNKGFFEIEISDNGPGFSKPDLEHYQQYLVKDTDIGDLKSIDISYALANFIIQKHNGKLTITSEEDKGTTVKIQLQIRQFLV